MNFTPDLGYTLVSITDSDIIALLQAGTISEATVVVLSADGTSTTETIPTGDARLTGTPSLVLGATSFSTGATVIPYSMYKITITATGQTSEAGCVVLDQDLNCQVHNAVLKNITSEACGCFLPYHIVLAVITNVNEYEDCSCDTALELYTQLKTEVVGAETAKTKSDCGCQ